MLITLPSWCKTVKSVIVITIIIPTIQNIFDGYYAGGGLWYISGYPIPGNVTSSCTKQAGKHHTDVLRVLNTKFVNNAEVLGAGLLFSYLNTEPPVSPFIISIENSTFTDNYQLFLFIRSRLFTSYLCCRLS